MREFIYFSSKARTNGNFSDLMKAGRLDIACHVVIMAFFISRKIRDDVKLHLLFYGPPDPPKHLELNSSQTMREFLSKKDVSGLLKRMLYKYKKDQKIKVFPGCFIEKKSFSEVVNNMKQENKKIYLLDKDGSDIRKMKFEKNAVFILGDQEGIPKHELKKLKVEKVSLGNVTYFASQALTILQNELDRAL